MSSYQWAFPEQMWSVWDPLCAWALSLLLASPNMWCEPMAATTASLWAQQTPHPRIAQSGAGSASGAVQEGWELAKVPLLAQLPCKMIRKINSTCIYFWLPLVWWWNASKIFPISRNWLAVQQQLLKDIGWYLKYYLCIESEYRTLTRVILNICVTLAMNNFLEDNFLIYPQKSLHSIKRKFS